VILAIFGVPKDVSLLLWSAMLYQRPLHARVRCIGAVAEQFIMSKGCSLSGHQSPDRLRDGDRALTLLDQQGSGRRERMAVGARNTLPIVISGGGIGGLACALALAQRRFLDQD
jgi:hypothetical protein